MNSNVSTSILLACAKKRWSQKDLSRVSGVSRTAISNIVSGKNDCSMKTLGALAGAFDMKGSEFLALGE